MSEEEEEKEEEEDNECTVACIYSNGIV